MANIHVDNRVLTNLHNEDIAKMINNVIDAEIKKDVSQMNTGLIDECVDLLIEIEKAKDDKFNALIPLVNSSKFLSIINHKHSGWKRLNIFARAAVVAAVIATGTFTVNAAVNAVADVNIIGEVGEAIHNTLVELGIIDKQYEQNTITEGNTSSKAATNTPITHNENPITETTINGLRETTVSNQQETSAVSKTTQPNHTRPDIIPVTVPAETTTEEKQEEIVTAVTQPQKPDKEIVFTGISVNSRNMKKHYIYNEKIDYTGLELYALYSDGSRKEIRIDDTTHTRNVDTTRVGDADLRITYKNCTVLIKITIRPDEDTRISEICSNKDYDYLLTDKGAYITKYKGNADRIVLDEIEGSDIFAIGNGVFRDSSITYFASNTVKKIFDSAFENASLLENSITPCVTYIGKNAYKDCSKLNEAIFSYNLSYLGAHAYERTNITKLSVPSGIREIPEFLCNQCQRLETVEMTENVTVIGRNAFNECHDLTSLTGTANIVKVDEAAFYEAEKLETDSNLPKLEYAGNIAFAYCKKINFGKLNENIKYIGDSAFQYCYKLTEVKIPSSIKEVPFCAFQGAHIEKLTIEEGVERIGEYAFMSTSFTDLILPKSLKHIGTYAFYSPRIRSVAGGENVTEIGSNAFYRSSRLTMRVVVETAMYYYAVDNNISHITFDKNGAIILPDQEL